MLGGGIASLLPVQDGVNDLDVGINESIYFFCMPSDAYERPKVLLNVD